VLQDEATEAESQSGLPMVHIRAANALVPDVFTSFADWARAHMLCSSNKTRRHGKHCSRSGTIGRVPCCGAD